MRRRNLRGQAEQEPGDEAVWIEASPGMVVLHLELYDPTTGRVSVLERPTVSRLMDLNPPGSSSTETN